MWSFLKHFFNRLLGLPISDEEPTRLDSHQELADKLITFIHAETWSESKAYLAQHPELLTDEAFKVIEMLIQGQDNKDAIRILTEHRALLSQARQKGLDEAFAQLMRPNAGTNALIPLIKALIACNRSAAVYELVAQHPELLSDEMDAFLRQAIANARLQGTAEGEANAQGVEQRHATLRQLRQMMDEMGMNVSEVVQAVRMMQQRSDTASQRPPQPVWDAVLAFVNAKSWGEKKRIVEQSCDLLLTNAALQVFADLLEQYKEDAEAIRRLTEHRDLLKRCQKEGIETAFADRVGSSSSEQGIAPEFSELLQQAIEATEHLRMDNSRQALDRAVTAWQVILSQPEITLYPELAIKVQGNLANTLRRRYLDWGQSEDLERAIESFQQALQATVQSSPTRPILLNNLGLALSDRFSLRGVATDLERAIENYRQALQATPQRSPDRPGFFNSLGNGLYTRFSLRGVAADLDWAIESYEQALQATPQGSSDRPGFLNSLGLALSDRFNLHGVAADLERVIESYQQALQATPQGSPHRPAFLNNLGNALSVRFSLRGGAADLERAIESYQQALQATPPSSPNRPVFLNNLGFGLQNRFSLRGVTADLERAIESYQQALQAAPQGSPDRPKWLNNLGCTFRGRFSLRGVAADLDSAIKSFQQALQATPQRSPGRPMLLNNLGNALSDRFSLRGVAADLDRAIESYQQALQATPQGSPERPKWLNNLGNALRFRFSLRGVAADLERAIESYQQALQVTPQGSPERPERLNNLGSALSACFSLRGVAADLERAIESYEKGLELLRSEPFPALRRMLAWNLGDVYYEQVDDLAKACQAYEQAAAAAEVIHRGIRRRRAKERQAEKNAYLYARLVYCCLATEDQASAFKYATMGKGRTLVDLLSSVQISLSNLPEKDKPLEKKVEQARQLKMELDAVSGELLGERPSIKQDASLPQQLSKAQQAKLTKELKRLRQQDKKLWEEIRDQFPDYFATQSPEPFTLEEAQGLASQLDATLVSYYRHDKGWVAFVIRPDLPFDSALKVVELPVKDEQLREWAVKFNSGLADRTLVNLRWSKKVSDALITPLVPHLPKPASSIPPNSREEETPLPILAGVGGRRLVLAPFSRLHLLPLATLPRTPIPWRASLLRQVRYLSDEYVVTITPSLAMLKRVMARRHRGEKREKLCAVAYPGRKGSKHYLQHVLPETQAIAPLFTHSTTRLDSAATRQAAIFDVTAHDVAHYSCHGLFDPEEVEQSSLLLSGSLLILRDIFNEVRLPNASLVTLSACETGMALPRQGDELAGMVQGFVYAGTPTVIASLWAVNDAATRYLFERFYEHYTTGIAAVDALRTAQQELRQHSYAHPYYWAAFQAVGAAYDSLPITSRSIRPAKEVIQPPTSSKTKGASLMSIPTAQAILDKAQRILQNIEPFASDIAQELTAEERSTFLATLEKLVTLAETISKESQLQLASDIISAFEAIPLLRENFVGDVDPETEQNKRQLTLQAALEGAKPLPSTRQEEQQVDNIYQIPLKKVCQLLHEQEGEHQEEHQEPEEDKG